MKRLLIILAATLIAVSCGRKVEEKVIQTYPNGDPMIVQQVKDTIIVGETRYYENGEIQYQKHYSDNAVPEGTWNFNYPNGKTFATADYSNPSAPTWMIYDHDGAPYYKDEFDSMKVMELGIFETPATLVYYKDHYQTELQFFSNGLLRCMGTWLDNQRDGLWTYYHPTGQKQTEATFKNGLRDGQYTVYYENGIPLYIGHYNMDTPCGTWEYYDPDGELIKTETIK